MSKKVIIGLGVGFVVVILVVIVVIPLFSSSRQPTNSKIPIIKPTTFAGDTQPSDATSQKYTSSYFNFSYPEGTVITQSAPSDQGYSVLLQSPATSSPASRISIQVTPSSISSMSDLKEIQTAFGLKQSEVRVGPGGAIQATLFKGELPLPVGAVKKSAVLFEQNGYIYKIDLSYQSDSLSPQAENFFSEVVSSFNPR